MVEKLLLCMPVLFVCLALLLRRNKLVYFTAIVIFGLIFRLISSFLADKHMVQIDLMVVIVEMFAVMFLFFTAQRRVKK